MENKKEIKVEEKRVIKLKTKKVLLGILFFVSLFLNLILLLFLYDPPYLSEADKLSIKLNKNNATINKLEKDINNLETEIILLENRCKNTQQSKIDDSSIDITDNDAVLENDGWRSFTFDKEKAYPDFDGFKIYFPQTWSISGNYSYGGALFDLLKENKEVIKINQAGYGGARCLYSYEEDYENTIEYPPQYKMEDNYVEIKKNNGTIWRLSKTIKGERYDQSYYLCELSQMGGKDVFSIPTNTGILIGNITTEESKQELIQILERIEILE